MQDLTSRSVADKHVDDPVPVEGHHFLDHGLLLDKILKNTELTNRSLGQFLSDVVAKHRTTELLSNEDGDLLGQTAFVTSQRASGSQEEVERSTGAGPVTRAVNTDRSLTKSRKDVTATWVNFVDGLRPDSPRMEDWVEFPSSKGSKSRDTEAYRGVRFYMPDGITRAMSPDGISRMMSPPSRRLDPLVPQQGVSRRIISASSPIASGDDAATAAGGFQIYEANECDEQSHSNSQTNTRWFLPAWSLRKHTRHAASKLLQALEHVQGMEDVPSEPRTTRASIKQILKSPEALQFASCLLILSHIVYMGFEVDMGLQAAKQGEESPDWLFKGDVIFAILFSLELLLRVNVERHKFIFGKDWLYNLFDIFLLLAQLADILFSVLNVGFLRAVRILRLLRAARALRTVRYFTELRLMVTSIISTLTSLFWAFLLLLLVLYLAAIAIMQIVEYHVRQDSSPMAEDVAMRHDVYEYYGSLGASLLTLFMSISGGADWIDLVKPLTQFSKAYVLIYVLYVSFMVFGVMNVLTAIFVESASQIAAIDQDLAIQEQLRKDKSTIATIKAMFYEADVDNSGVLTQDELETLLENPKYIWAMRLVGVDVSEARGLFKLLDINECQAVSIDEFVTGMMRLKGGAKGVDLATLIYENKRMYAYLQDSLNSVQNGVAQLEQYIARASIVRPERKKVSFHGNTHNHGPNGLPHSLPYRHTRSDGESQSAHSVATTDGSEVLPVPFAL